MILLIPLITWLLGQLLKFFYQNLGEKQFRLHHLLDYGGMPSTHSAMVSSLATIVGSTQGARSPLFQIVIVSGLFVVSDALKLRNALSAQSKIVNALREDLPTDRKNSVVTAPEQLGHTFLEILVGLGLGVVLSLALYLLMRDWDIPYLTP